ncbi:MAG: hypothetical protein ABJB49_04430 [Nitrospirota bacterium]
MASELAVLWKRHQQEALPAVPTAIKGELWVLDEVIGGCITHYLEGGLGLDSGRSAILHDCRADLDRLLPDLEGPAVDYFQRLGILAELVLRASAVERTLPERGDNQRSQEP